MTAAGFVQEREPAVLERILELRLLAYRVFAGRLQLRLLRAATLATFAGASAYLLIAHRAAIAHALGQIARANLGWSIAAVAAEVASVFAYGLIVRIILGIGGVRGSVLGLAGLTVIGTAMLNSLPAGQALSTTYWFAQLRRRGAEHGLAAVAMLGATLIGIFSLIVLLAAGLVIGGPSTGALHAARTPVLIGAAVFAAVRIVAHRPLKRGLFWLTRRLSADDHVFPAEQVRPHQFATLALLGYTNWLFDLLALLFALEAVHASAPWRGLLAIYALSQIVATLPLLPGGGGAVEATLAASLIAYGAHGAITAGVLLYRVISAWGFVPAGWAIWALDGRARTARQPDAGGTSG